MATDQDFAEFVGARWGSLYRLAYLLAASPAGAEDLLQTTLEKAYVSWGRISAMEYPEAYVRRMITTTLVSSRRRAWIRERPTEHLPETGADSGELGALDRSLLWPLVCALPERQRAVIVLRYYEDMTEAADRADDGLRTRHGEVAVLGGHGSAAPGARGVGRRPGSGRAMSLDEELRTTLGLEAGARSVPPPDVLGLIRGGRIRRRRRTVARLGAVAVAALLVGAIGLGVATEPPRGSGAGLPARPDRRNRGIPRSISDRVVLPPDTYRAYVGRQRGRWRDHRRLHPRRAVLAGRRLRDPDRPVRRTAGFGVYQPDVLAASGTGCADDPMAPAPGTSPQALARRLARLPAQHRPPGAHRTEAFGFPAEHLRLQIDVDCPTYYLVAHGRTAPAESPTPPTSRRRTSSSTSGCWTSVVRSWSSTSGTTSTRHPTWSTGPGRRAGRSPSSRAADPPQSSSSTCSADLLRPGSVLVGARVELVGVDHVADGGVARGLGVERALPVGVADPLPRTGEDRLLRVLGVGVGPGLLVARHGFDRTPTAYRGDPP